jgi:formate dehydrogenase assembly factor FdhD
VNGEKLLTLLCSPARLDCPVVGSPWGEKVIQSVDDIRRLTVSGVAGRAEVELIHPGELPKARILTSDCGGGITCRIDPRVIPRADLVHIRLQAPGAHRSIPRAPSPC